MYVFISNISERKAFIKGSWLCQFSNLAINDNQRDIACSRMGHGLPSHYCVSFNFHPGTHLYVHLIADTR